MVRVGSRDKDFASSLFYVYVNGGSAIIQLSQLLSVSPLCERSLGGASDAHACSHDAPREACG